MQETNKPAAAKEETKAHISKGKGSVENKRGLRRKLDNDDILLKKLNMDAFDSFK